MTILLAIGLLVSGYATGKPSAFAKDSTILLLILPPYDEVANAGSSPDTQRILETALTNKGRLSVIPFPFKKLMGVPYQMVFDKRYCDAILKKVDCDVIIMTQIITDNERRPGIWPWSYNIRVFNARTNKQVNSIKGENIKAEDFAGDMTGKVGQLIKDIELTFKTR